MAKNYILNVARQCEKLNLAAFFFALGDIYFIAYCACLLVCVGLRFEI